MASGNTPKAPPEPKVAGVAARNTATNELGIVLRWCAGLQRFGVTWLADALNQKTKPVKQQAGGKGASTTSGYKYYADVAGVACLGVVEGITEIWMDAEKVWNGDLSRNGGDSAVITIEHHGTVTIYWGTETQPIDPILAPHGHPAYRGQCYLMFKQLLFGEGRTNAPNIEVVLRRYPADTGLATPVDWDSDCNPAHAIIDLLTDPRCGLGWDRDATLDLPSWETAAAQMRAEELAISPLLDREQPARDVLTGILEYCDGYFVVVGGKLALRLARPPAREAADALPLWGEYDLVDTPAPVPQSWRETFNEINVRFTDRDWEFQADSEPWRDLAARRAAGVPRTQTIDRPWFTRRYQASRAAAYAGRLLGVPALEMSGVQIRKEAAAGVTVGSFVRFTYADYATTLLMRVIRRKVPSDRAQLVEFDLRADGYFGDVLPFTPDFPPPPDPPETVPEPPLAAALIELPYGLVPAGGDAQRPFLAALVARASALDVRWRTYTSQDGDAYDEVEDPADRWAFHGTLAAPVPVTPVLDDSADGILVDLAGPDGPADLESVSERGRLRMKLLVFIGDEIISYRDAAIVSLTRARLTGLRRGCYDTVTHGHPAGAGAFIIRRSNLHAFTSSTYKAGDNLLAKVSTATAMAELDLTDAPLLALPLVGRSSVPLPALNLRVNGRAAGATWPAGQDVLIEWDNASWVRNRFFNHWEDPYFDALLKAKLRIFDQDGVTLRRRVKIDAGLKSYVYAASDLTADFGGDEPGRFIVQLFNKYRGVRSQPLQITVNRA